jgi:hypothetical protein
MRTSNLQRVVNSKDPVASFAALTDNQKVNILPARLREFMVAIDCANLDNVQHTWCCDIFNLKHKLATTDDWTQLYTLLCATNNIPRTYTKHLPTCILYKENPKLYASDAEYLKAIFEAPKKDVDVAGLPLTEAHRRILLLRYKCKYSVRKIADILSTTQGTINKYLNDALNIIQGGAEYDEPHVAEEPV